MRIPVILLIASFLPAFLVHAAGKKTIAPLEHAPPKNTIVIVSPVIRIIHNDTHTKNETDLWVDTANTNSLRDFFDFPLLFLHKNSNIDGVVVANQETRTYNGIGDTIYVRQSSHRLRKGTLVSIAHPDDTVSTAHLLQTLGTPAWEVASGVVINTTSDTATLKVVSARQEIILGDVITMEPRRVLENCIMHYSLKPITGKIINIAWKKEEASLYSIVTLDKGTMDGVQPGHVFLLHNASDGPSTCCMDAQGTRRWLQATGQTTPLAAATIFLVYDHISYGMITDSRGSVFVGDQGTTLTRHYDRLNPSLRIVHIPEEIAQ